MLKEEFGSARFRGAKLHGLPYFDPMFLAKARLDLQAVSAGKHRGVNQAGVRDNIFISQLD
jgi:hypothetical protein